MHQTLNSSGQIAFFVAKNIMIEFPTVCLSNEIENRTRTGGELRGKLDGIPNSRNVFDRKLLGNENNVKGGFSCFIIIRVGLLMGAI